MIQKGEEIPKRFQVVSLRLTLVSPISVPGKSDTNRIQLTNSMVPIYTQKLTISYRINFFGSWKGIAGVQVMEIG